MTIGMLILLILGILYVIYFIYNIFRIIKMKTYLFPSSYFIVSFLVIICTLLIVLFFKSFPNLNIVI